MKAKLFFLLLLTPLFFLTACSGNKAVQQVNSESGTESSAGREFRRPDFGQPDSPADVRGLINAVVGNEVTVLKIDRPQDRAAEGGDSGEKENDADEKKTTLGTGTTGRMPGMGRGMRGGQAQDEDTQAQRLERMKEMASGEETFIIPVGIQMLKPVEGSTREKLEMLEATLEDIKENTMIQVWLDDSILDRKVAEFVLIMN